MTALPAFLRCLTMRNGCAPAVPPASGLRKLDCLEYEDRTLFSATPMGAELLVATAADGGPVDAPSSTTSDTAIADTQANDSASNSAWAATTDETSNSGDVQLRRELVVVDTSIVNYQQLVDDLTAQADDARRFELLLLDPSQDGLQQITDKISQYDGLSAIHFVTHAGDGELRLGQERLTAANFNAYSQQFALWRASLADDADLLFYGCELAASADGRALLTNIEQATGADVAASTDNTGNALFGGNWQFEFTSGGIETTAAFSTAVQTSWMNLLNVTVDNVSSTGGDSQASFTIGHQTSGTNRLMLVGISIDPHGDTVTSVTYNGVALTRVGQQFDAALHASVEIWALVAPANGNHNVVVNLSGTSYNGIGIGVMTFNGVDQTTPLGSFAGASGSGTAASVTVGSQANDIVFGLVSSHSDSTVASPDAAQTEYWNLQNAKATASGTTEAGAASVTNSWTVHNDDWAAGAISVRSGGNTAPVLDATKTPVLNNVAEDAAAPSGAVGTLVSSLVDFASPAGQVDNVTDTDGGAQLGIAVTDADATNGTWWYSTDGGVSWNLLGAVADNNARLLAADAGTRLYFQPNANYSGTITGAVTFRAWDQSIGTNGTLADTTSNGGATPFSTATDTAAITVGAVNDAPTIMVPGSQSTDEETNLTFSSGNGNQISIDDIDAGSSSVQVTLTVTSGALTLNGTTGLSFTTGDGTADASLQFTGTVADINAALNGMIFAPTSNFTGAVGLGIVVNDQGNTGSGGAQGDTDSVAITVTAVNDAPVNTVPGPQTMNEDATLVFSSGNGNQMSIADIDAGSSSIQVTLTATNGTITLGGAAGLSFVTGDGTADETMTFTGTVANINTALNGLSFAPTADFNGTAGLQIVTDDQGNTGSGGPLSATDSVVITVNAVNDAPVLDNTGTMTLTTIPEDDTANNGDTVSAILASGGGDRMTDVDASPSEGIAVTSLNSGNGTWQYDTGSGWVDVGAVSNASALLLRDTDRLRFLPNGLNATTGDITFRAWDQTGGVAGTKVDVSTNGGTTPYSTAVETAGITVTAVNDAPVNTVPGPQTMNEDATLTFSGGNGNQISIADVDAAGGMLQVTLTATNGVLSLGGVSGLSFITGDGTTDATMTFTGTIADINTALNGLSFTPTANFNGSASLQIVTDDQGNTGSGGALSSTDTIAITVNAVNDGPTLSLPAPQSTPFQTSLTLSTSLGNGLMLGDLDAGSGTLQLTLTATNGTVTLARLTGLTLITGTGTADSTVVVQGSLADLNATVDGLVFTPATAYRGAAAVTVSLDDGGNTGSGGPLTTSGQINIDVDPAAQRLLFSGPSNQAATDFHVTFSAADGNPLQFYDVYLENPTLTVTISATDGILTLSTTQGLAFTSGTGSGSSMSFTGSLADVNAALEGAEFSTTATDSSLIITAADPPRDGTGPHSAGTTIAVAQPAVYPAPSTTPPVVETVEELVETERDASGTTVVIPPTGFIAQQAIDTWIARAKPPAAEIVAGPISKSDGVNALPPSESHSAPPVEQRWEQPNVTAAQIKAAVKVERPHLRTHITAEEIPWSRAVFAVNDSGASSLSNDFIVGTAGITASLSVGYVLWSIRAASLLSTMLSSMPAWQSFDPLPVINQVVQKRTDTDDDAEEMF